LTAFTDGGPGLRWIPAEAGSKKPPKHPKQAESGLSAGTPGRMQANAVIVPGVKRLHWRIWNGKTKYARRTLERVRKVMHVFQGERLKPAGTHETREFDGWGRQEGGGPCAD
jgi:hypothetical protein